MRSSPLQGVSFRVLLIPLLLILTGCGVENLAGVELATVVVAPTDIIEPTTTPDPLTMELPNSTSKEFVGATISLRYPAGWEREESGQTLTVFDPESEFGVGLFIRPTGALGIDLEAETVAPQVMRAVLRGAAEFGALPPEAVPSLEDVRAFRWGDQDAALYRWHGTDEREAGVSVLVLNDGRDRLILFTTQAAPAVWQTFETTWLAVLGSVTLDGEALPAADILSAYQEATTT